MITIARYLLLHNGANTNPAAQVSIGAMHNQTAWDLYSAVASHYICNPPISHHTACFNFPPPCHAAMLSGETMPINGKESFRSLRAFPTVTKTGQGNHA